ncbi:hypothetical protein YC2023_072117 [Brassica napus]
MTTGRINQVAFINLGKTTSYSRKHMESGNRRRLDRFRSINLINKKYQNAFPRIIKLPLANDVSSRPRVRSPTYWLPASQMTATRSDWTDLAKLDNQLIKTEHKYEIILFFKLSSQMDCFQRDIKLQFRSETEQDLGFRTFLSSTHHQTELR